MPGKQAQVDWGFFENYKVIDEFGIERKLYCFLMILGYSRMRYIEFVTDMTTETLIKCHINAFHYFKGYPNEILYDYMKQVVLKRMLSKVIQHLTKHLKILLVFINLNQYYADHIKVKQKEKLKEQLDMLEKIL